MMRRVIELEKTSKEPSLLELFKGTDLRRTLIVAGVYAAQNLTGNLIANQAVYFFERTYRDLQRPLQKEKSKHADFFTQRPASRPRPPSR